MEERKTIFDYLERIFIQFGISVTIMCVLCLIFGEKAQEVSSLFGLGKEGLTIPTLFQFLLLSGLITGIRTIFFTDFFFKNMSEVRRTVWMLVFIIMVLGVSVYEFKWFPPDRWELWVLLFLSFGICFGVSVGIVHCKEKMENRRMEEALKKLKEGIDTENEGTR